MVRQLSTSVASDEESITQDDTRHIPIPRVDEVHALPGSGVKAELCQTILRRKHETLFDNHETSVSNTSALLRRTQSSSFFTTRRRESKHDAWWPRRLSFSEAEEAVLTWEDISLPAGDIASAGSTLADGMAREELLSRQAKRMQERMFETEHQVGIWVQEKLQGVEALHADVYQAREELSGVYHQRLEEVQRRRGDFTALLGEERSHLTEAIRDVEILGAKLEYELNALDLKVHDVEHSVAEFDRLVTDVETRAQALEAGEKASESWAGWVTRLLSGSTANAALVERSLK